MKLPRDILSKKYIKPRIFLCDVDKTRMCQLHTTETQATLKFNAYSELSFEISRVYNDFIAGETKVNPYYDKVEALRLIEVEGFGYFQIQGPELVNDGIKEIKSVTAYSLEYALSQKYLNDFIINMGTIGSVEVTEAETINPENPSYIPVTFYNVSNPKLSLLHLVLESAYGWKIGHVDNSLKTMSRQFEIDRQSVYDFLMNEVCEKFNCHIEFDTYSNTINIYAESMIAKLLGDGTTRTFTISPMFDTIGSVTMGEYKTTQYTYNSSNGQITFNEAPTAGTIVEITDGTLEKWETDVFVSFDNLAQEVNVNYEADDIKTMLTITYGDNGTIREANLGLPYLIDLSYYMTPEWMGKDLCNKWIEYQKLCNEKQSEYTAIAQELEEYLNKQGYEQTRVSLGYEVDNSVGSDTVGKRYVRGGDASSGYYYTEVSLPSEYVAGVNYYKVSEANLTSEKISRLFYALRDLAKHTKGSTDWYESFEDLRDDFEFTITSTYSFDSFFNGLKTATNALTNWDPKTQSHPSFNKGGIVDTFLLVLWAEFGSSVLKSYLESYKSRQSANIEYANTEDRYLYYPITCFVDTLQQAYDARLTTISDIQTNQIDTRQAQLAAIGEELALNRHFGKESGNGEDYLAKLHTFLREDELHLDDIVETSQDSTIDHFKTKQHAIELGRIELQKICQPRLQFSMDMANIYALKEFDPIVNQFQLGNVIKVAIRDGYIKQSRLLQVNINFDDFSDFSCEFGELTNFRTQSDIHADLLSQAVDAGKSVAQYSGYWTRGSDQANSIDLRLQEGLLNSIEALKATDATQAASMDKYGIHLEKIDPNTGEIDDKRIWMVNNQIVFTDDGFKTAKTVLGEFEIGDEKKYGLLADAVVAGYVEGSSIKGGTISIGENKDGTAVFAVDENGHVTMNAASITGYVTNDNMSSAIEQKAGEITQTVTASIRPGTNYFGTCNTAGGTKDKIVNCADFVFENNVIPQGASITVRFEYANNVDNPTLNVNNTGAKTIAIQGRGITADGNYNWSNASTMSFVYYNGYWTIDNNVALIKTSEIKQTADAISLAVSETRQRQSYYGTCDTAGGTQIKVVTCTDFVIPEGGTIPIGATIIVSFSYKNAITNPKLNVNGTGAKFIKAGGEKITTTDGYNWDDNSTMSFVYDGTDWIIDNSSVLYKAAQLKITADGINSNVTSIDSRVGMCETNIIQLNDSISTSVKKGDLGSLITQEVDNIKIAWNQSSKYFAFEEDGSLNIYGGAGVTYTEEDRTLSDDSTIKVNKVTGGTVLMKLHSGGQTIYDTSGKRLMDLHSGGQKLYDTDGTSTVATFDRSGMHFWKSNIETGSIGTGYYSNDPTYRGLGFGLANSANYMVWSHGDGNGSQITKLEWHKADKTFSNGGQVHKGFSFNDDVRIEGDDNGVNPLGHIWLDNKGMWIHNGYNYVSCLDWDGLRLKTSSNGNFINFDSQNSSAHFYSSVEFKDSVDFSARSDNSSDIKVNFYGRVDFEDTVRFANTQFCSGYTADFNGTTNFNGSTTFKTATKFDKTITIGPTDGTQLSPAIHCYGNINMHQNDITNQSDVRLKTNIQDVKIDVVDKINKIQIKEYDWLIRGAHENMGIIAQQLQPIFPELVSEDANTGVKSIITSKFIPYLIKAIQELYAMMPNNTKSEELLQIEEWSDEYSLEEKLAFIERVREIENNS